MVSGLSSSPASAAAGMAFAKAGYILFTVITGMVIVMLVHLHSREAQIIGGDLVLRTHGCLLLGFESRITNNTAFLVRPG
jgi:hypothetical protein